MLELGEGVITEAIRDVLSGRVLLLSMQMYGCRVVQKALEVGGCVGGWDCAVCCTLYPSLDQGAMRASKLRFEPNYRTSFAIVLRSLLGHSATWER